MNKHSVELLFGVAVMLVICVLAGIAIDAAVLEMSSVPTN